MNTIDVPVVYQFIIQEKKGITTFYKFFRYLDLKKMIEINTFGIQVIQSDYEISENTLSLKMIISVSELIHNLDEIGKRFKSFEKELTVLLDRFSLPYTFSKVVYL
jgi:hypothetical protein